MSDAALVGQVLGGDYLIEERVGQGGMAWVYRGTHKRLGGEVAVKILFSHFLDDQGLRTRFLREARSQYTLNHPNIVRVLDFIEESGVVGFVSEWCDAGELLRWWGPRDGVLSLARLQALIFPILDAMGYAHEQGIIHRDLKPHNILVQRRGDDIVPKVTDFGIAKFAQQQGLTRPGMMVGTLQYMAPEQVEGRLDTDLRSDIYSIGVILYQMLSGHLPFEGESMSLVMKVLEHDPPTLPDTCIPGPVGDVVMRCLHKDPGQRYLSCEQVKAALSDAISRCDDGVALTETWQERVRAHHSLDTQSDVSLVRPTLDNASSDSDAAASPALEQTSADVPTPQRASSPASERSSRRLTQTIPPRSVGAQASSQDPEDDVGLPSKFQQPDDTNELPASKPTMAPLGVADTAPSAVARKGSAVRPIPKGLPASDLGPPRMRSQPAASAPKGRGKRVLVGLFLLLCGVAAGGYVVLPPQTILEYWHQLWGETSAPMGDGGRLIVARRRADGGANAALTDAAAADAAQARAPDTRRSASDAGGASPDVQAASAGADTRRACRKGDGKACYQVGVAFVANARKAPKAKRQALASQAYHWLQKACEEEYGQGCFALARLHREGFGAGRVDGAKARHYHRIACQAGIHDACMALGHLYEKVLGGPYDAAQAIAFYRKACEGKVAAGCRLAGLVWQRRLDKKARSCKHAKELWRQACSMGDQQACALQCNVGVPQ